MADINLNLPTGVKNEEAHPRRQTTILALARVCISLVLLASATLKLYSGPSIYSDAHAFIKLNPILFTSIIIFEYVISIALIFNIRPMIILPTTSLLISLLTAISAWLVASGAHSCPCFGYLAPPPWIVLGLDLLMLLSLIQIRPLYTAQSGSSRFPVPVISGIVQFIGLVVLLVGLGIEARYISTSIHLDGLLEGIFPGPIDVQPRTISVLLPPDGTRQVEFQISNHSPTACSVVGGTFGCAPDICIDNISLPVDIPPGTTKSAIISVGRQPSPGAFSKEFVFFTSSNEQPRIGVRINIEVSKPR